MTSARDSLDVVLGLSFETWDDMVRRDYARPPDRLAQFLRTSDQVDRLLVVNPWRNVGGQLLRLAGHKRDAPFPTSSSAWLLRPVRLRRREPSSVNVISRSYVEYGRIVRTASRIRKFRAPVLITFNPFFAAFGRHDGFRSVTYVARDDWASYHGTPHLRAAYLRAYEVIRERRIAVSAVSEELLRRLAPLGESRVVPNAVDPEVWSTLRPEPSALADLPRPLAVYTGTIDERLSLPALRSLGRAFAAGTILLIGPHDEQTTANIRAVAPNVVIRGALKQTELAAYVQAADVCVLPHAVSDLTCAMSPLKIYEYVAAGSLVVATDLPPVRNISDAVRLVTDLDKFGQDALAAANSARPKESERMRFIAENAWSARCATILDLARSAVNASHA